MFRNMRLRQLCECSKLRALQVYLIMIAWTGHFPMQSPHPWQVSGSTMAGSLSSIRKMALTGQMVSATHLLQRRHLCGLMNALCILPARLGLQVTRGQYYQLLTLDIPLYIEIDRRPIISSSFSGLNS